MTFRTIASGSSGNCYLVEDQGRKLLVEAGILFRRIQEALSFKVTTLDGCLISHCHGDHAKSMNNVMAAGIDVYASQETFDALKCTDHRAYALHDRKETTIGAFKVMPIEVPHDTPGTFAYFVKGPSGEILFFATDYGFMPIVPEGVHILALEANFDPEIMKSNNIHSSRFARVTTTHNSIERLEKLLGKMIDAGFMTTVREIHLLHLSSTNSNSEEFKERIQRKTGKIVRIAGEAPAH